jgi:hypothetical protein
MLSIASRLHENREHQSYRYVPLKTTNTNHRKCVNLQAMIRCIGRRQVDLGEIPKSPEYQRCLVPNISPLKPGIVARWRSAYRHHKIHTTNKASDLQARPLTSVLFNTGSMIGHTSRDRYNDPSTCKDRCRQRCTSTKSRIRHVVEFTRHKRCKCNRQLH